MDFCQTDKVRGISISEKFIQNVKGILYNKTHIHHSHITGDVIGYSNSQCNFRVRENKKKPVSLYITLFALIFSFS